MKKFEVELTYGKLVVEECSYDEYKGVDIEFVPYNETDDDDVVCRPRVLVEQYPDTKDIRVAIWADPNSEDWTDDIDFDIERYKKGVKQ